LIATLTISFLPTALAETPDNFGLAEPHGAASVLTGADTPAPLSDSGLPFKLVNNYGPTELLVVATREL